MLCMKFRVVSVQDRGLRRWGKSLYHYPGLFCKLVPGLHSSTVVGDLLLDTQGSKEWTRRGFLFRTDIRQDMVCQHGASRYLPLSGTKRWPGI